MEKEALQDVADHETSVADTARSLAKEVGWPTSDLGALWQATRIHDIGKLNIPTEILRHKGKLVGEPWAIMKSHARMGAEILGGVRGLPRIFTDVAKYHHERYDGQGYEGLSDESIPFAARIVAIADVHDALRASRDYKPPMPEESALLLMTGDTRGSEMGRRAFDPALLRKFVAMRLADAEFECSKEGRETLSAFASSDPMDDLSEEMRGRLEISRDGHRRVFVEEGAGRLVVMDVDPAGFVDVPDEPEDDARDSMAL